MLKLWRRIQYLLRSRQSVADLSEELEFHRALKQEELEESGIAPGEAVFEARRALGNTTLSREDARSVWISPWLESFWQDLSYGLRSMRRQPGFTLLALLALGCAIGLNTSLFTAFNAVALRPWPVKDPGRMVNIFQSSKSASQENARYSGLSIAEYRYLSGNTQSFSGMLATREEESFKLEGQPGNSLYVSGNYFSVLAVDMERGRGFRTDEDRTESPQAVAVIGFATWANRFGSDPGIIGRRVRLGDVLFTVVGVAPERFAGTSPQRIDVWIPLSAILLLRPNEPGRREFFESPNHCCSQVAGRLAKGVERDRARAELELLSDQYRSHHKLESRGVLLTGTAFLASPNSKRRQIYPVFGLMFIGVILVLLLACANVGNLLLARAAARSREISLRISLGAARRRVIRQLLTESLVLASIAGATGIAIAYVLPSYVLSRVAEPVSIRLEPDLTVLAFSVGLSILSCFAFGLAPALHGTRGDLNEGLKERSGPAGIRLSLRGFLLAVQVAVSVILLVGAGLLLRGVQHARTQDPGFNVKNVTVVSFDFPASSYGVQRTRSFYRELETGMKSLPGSRQFGLTEFAPLGNSRRLTGFQMPGEDDSKSRTALLHEVTAGYFEVLGIPIVAGRNFEPADEGRNTILINETMAERYWPGESALGKTIRSGAVREIAGIVKDAYTTDLGQIEPAIYQQVSGRGAPKLMISGTGAGSWEPVIAAAKRIDPRVELRVTALAENFDGWLKSSRIGASIAGALGVLALTLAAIGVFGVFAYSLQLRTREIGVRMALGAQPRQVIGIVLRSSSRALLIGLAVGLAGAMAGSRLIEGQLYGVSRFDLRAYTGVVLLLTTAALAASYLPARRATKIDPMKALRYE